MAKKMIDTRLAAIDNDPGRIAPIAALLDELDQ